MLELQCRWITVHYSVVELHYFELSEEISQIKKEFEITYGFNKHFLQLIVNILGANGSEVECGICHTQV